MRKVLIFAAVCFSIGFVGGALQSAFDWHLESYEGYIAGLFCCWLWPFRKPYHHQPKEK